MFEGRRVGDVPRWRCPWKALGDYEESELWPRVVQAFIQEWKPDAAGKHGAKEEIVANAMDDLITSKMRDLETGLESLDEDFARRLDKIVMKEATEKVPGRPCFVCPFQTHATSLGGAGDGDRGGVA